MKKLIIYTFVSLLFFSCKEEPKRTDYVISGTAKGIYNGVRVHLNTTDERGRERPVETQMVVNEKFTFEGTMDTPTLYHMTVNSVPGKLPIMVENSEIQVDINKANISKSKITGSKSQSTYESYHKGLEAIERELRPLNMELRRARSQRDMAKQAELNTQIEAVNDKRTHYVVDYINEHSANFFSLYLIKEELKNPKLDIEKLMDAFNNLSTEIESSKDGAAIKVDLEKRYTIYMKTANLEIGKKAPNFKAPTANGKLVSLNDLMGKVTIIDFWAAWCGPCRRENPNVVKVYNEFHDEGLEIIGVSLDGSRGQKDPKKAWLDAVEKDQLKWNQVSHLKYFNDPVAQLYNIKSIPATYILDKDGTIVAKNLRGDALRQKVGELLKK